MYTNSCIFSTKVSRLLAEEKLIMQKMEDPMVFNKAPCSISSMYIYFFPTKTNGIDLQKLRNFGNY